MKEAQIFYLHIIYFDDFFKFNFACAQYEVIYCIVLNFTRSLIMFCAKCVWVMFFVWFFQKKYLSCTKTLSKYLLSHHVLEVGILL